MHAIDLTHIIQTGMPVFPGDSPVTVQPSAFVHRDGFAQTALSLATHVGTHVDIPAHILADAPGIDALDPDCFVGYGTVVDCTGLESRQIEPHHVAHLAAYDVLDFVLFRTGWDVHWQTDQYFSGFPIISESTCRSLGDLQLKGIGLDTPSPDVVDSHDFPAHRLLLDHGMVIVENLRNLSALPETSFLFSCLPLRIDGGDGSPVRAVGLLLS